MEVEEPIRDEDPGVPAAASLPHAPPVTAKGRFPKLIGSPLQAELDFVGTAPTIDRQAGQSPKPWTMLLEAEGDQGDVQPPEVQPVVPVEAWMPAASLSNRAWWLKPWIWGVAAVSVGMIWMLVDVLRSVEPVVVMQEAPEIEPAQRVVSRPELPEVEVAVPAPVAAKPEPVDLEPKEVEVEPKKVEGVIMPEVKPEPVLVKLKAPPDQAQLIEPPSEKGVPEVVVEPGIVAPVKPSEEVLPATPPEEVVPVVAEDLSLEGLDAAALLGRFLEAQGLEQRLPMMASRASLQDLQQTCLAHALPPRMGVELNYKELHPGGLGEDAYFKVRFGGDSGSDREHLLLVRRKGDGIPKVMVDSFLDLYGGRLEAFAAKPCEGIAEFDVVVKAMASCKDRQVPGHEAKMTLRLMECDEGKGLANAYFGKQSPIAVLLEDGSFRLSYGSPTLCRVALQWNRKEDPRRPYLEAVEIKAFGWGSECDPPR